MSIVLVPNREVQCRFCNKQMLDTESFSGKNMWHSIEPTCYHEQTFCCQDCWLIKSNICDCRICGNQINYC
jgi:hypothetical protein